MPPLVENGNTVPMTVSVASPMTPADHVKSIHVFNEKNPQPNIGNFYLGPRAGRAQVSTRIRLADSQKIVAIARLSRRLVLVRQRRRRGDAGGLHRGGDLMASALINVPAKAKRGEIIEIKTLMSHIMETGYRHTARARRSARHHHELLLPLQRRRDFPRRTVSGDLGESVHHLLHGGHRERQVRIRMDRRQRFYGDRVGLDNRRMRFGSRISLPALLIAALPSGAAEIPQAERRSGYSFMTPDTQAMQNDDSANPGMLWVLDGEKLWKRKAAPRAKPAPIATGMRAPA